MNTPMMNDAITQHV